jgi:Na+-transporting methylmalonyl-CoA/oxaloacetate decarboxylase gamma subunit
MLTNILLQAPAAVGTASPNEHFKLLLFWSIVALCVALFIFFLRKTDKLISKDIVAPEPTPVKKAEKVKDPKGEEAAAIALAIHLYKSQLHDMESFTITMQKVSRIYSPWSSKIYTLRQNPRH